MINETSAMATISTPIISTSVPNPMPFGRPFVSEYDMMCNDCDTVWDAHAMVVSDANLPDNGVLKVEYVGTEANCWPTVKITFKDIYAARAYTAAYLGIDVADGWDVQADDEVMGYLAPGQFV